MEGMKFGASSNGPLIPEGQFADPCWCHSENEEWIVYTVREPLFSIVGATLHGQDSQRVHVSTRE
jgi:hypothetical protein